MTDALNVTVSLLHDEMNAQHLSCSHVVKFHFAEALNPERHIITEDKIYIFPAKLQINIAESSITIH
jgi:hypothetical protein